MSEPIRAVTFDFWDTLVRSDVPAFRASRRAALVDVLASDGREVDDEVIAQGFDRAWRAFDVAWGRNEQFTAVDAARVVVGHLGLAVGTDLGHRLVEAYVGAGVEVEVPLTPNVARVLAGLKDSGIAVGIVCDVGLTPSPTLRAILHRHGVLELFDHWSFSDEVGRYKPHREIFEHALGGLGGVAPAQSAHIGDLRRTDVAGARAMGMRSLRYRGVTDDDPANGPEADHIVDDHGDLLDILGI